MILRHINSHAGVSVLETLNSTERRALPSYLATRLSGDKAEVDAAAWEQAAVLDITLDDLTIPAAEIKRELHRAGLWTNADILANLQKAKSAIGDAIIARLLHSLSAGS